MQARVAERLQVSRATVSKWVRRYRAAGVAGLADHSSRPHSSPSQTCRRTERRVLALRLQVTANRIDAAARVHVVREIKNGLVRQAQNLGRTYRGDQAPTCTR